MIHEPMRAHTRSLLAGCVLAIVGVAACLVVGFVHPEGGLDDATIAMVKESGALYVRIDDTWHPALNLSSARLIAGTAATPQLIDARELRKTRRGALLGIPGAPDVMPDTLSAEASPWTVCDDSAGTTVIVGELATDGIQPLAADQAVLARSRSDAATYLLYNGRRARVSLAEAAVVRALHLESLEPLDVSSSVLNAIPEAPAITLPPIAGAGRHGPALLGGLPVGSVVRVERAGADELYVVLERGVQRVGRVAADILRFSDSQGYPDIRTVAADAISATPIVETLPVTTFPDTVSAERSGPVVCARWLPGDANDGHSVVLAGRVIPLAPGHADVRLAQSDGNGPNVDRVFIPPGRCLDVQSTYRYVVRDTGVRFAVRDAEAAAALGLSTAPASGPWPILRLLPEGPELSRAAALVARDSVASDVRAAAVPSLTTAPAPG